MLEVKKNDRVMIHKAARPHRHGGFVSSTNVNPEETAYASVLKITKRKTGRQMHVRDDRGYGYSIAIDQPSEFMTITVIEG